MICYFVSTPPVIELRIPMSFLYYWGSQKVSWKGYPPQWVCPVCPIFRHCGHEWFMGHCWVVIYCVLMIWRFLSWYPKIRIIQNWLLSMRTCHQFKNHFFWIWGSNISGNSSILMFWWEDGSSVLLRICDGVSMCCHDHRLFHEFSFKWLFFTLFLCNPSTTPQ